MCQYEEMIKGDHSSCDADNCEVLLVVRKQDLADFIGEPIPDELEKSDLLDILKAFDEDQVNH